MRPMGFGNKAGIDSRWRVAVCVTIRVLSEICAVSPRSDRRDGTSLYGHESERMGFTAELRSPTTWYTKVAISLLALTIFVFLAAGAVSGYLVYRMISPSRSHSEIDLQHFPGHPVLLNFTADDGPQRDGWFFPGLKSAPAIILCPAYESSRGELLTLASALQDQQYN